LLRHESRTSKMRGRVTGGAGGGIWGSERGGWGSKTAANAAASTRQVVSWPCDRSHMKKRWCVIGKKATRGAADALQAVAGRKPSYIQRE